MQLPLPDYLQPLATLNGPYPEAVIAEAIERRDETIPHLIRSLEFTLENAEHFTEDPAFMLPIYAVALLGFFEAEAALPVLVALGRHPQVNDLLDDGISELLPAALASCAKSNPTALSPLIEDEDADEFCRASAIEALATLFAHEHLTRDALDAYLVSLYQGKLKPDLNFAWEEIFQISLEFGFHEHLPLIEKIYDQCDNLFCTYEREQIRAFSRDGLPPEYHSTRGFIQHPDCTLSHWHCFTPEYALETEDEDWDDDLNETETGLFTGQLLNQPPSPPVTYQRPTPKVGRNDPCPCGSGKKFKKCCGA